MNLISLLLICAKYRYIVYRVLLRIKWGKKRRDDYLQRNQIWIFDFLPDFLPERAYSFNGIKAIPRRGTHDFLMLFIAREEELKSQFIMYPNETFVDVGAGIGSYTLRIAEEYKTKAVRVIAIEAHPENYKALRRNVECNDFKHVKTVNKAASDRKGTIMLHEQRYVRRSNAAQYTFAPSTADQTSLEGMASEIECDTIDDIVGSGPADLMKVDIEGAEVLALKGASNTLKKLRKIVVEIHGDNFEKVSRILEMHGYDLEFIRGFGDMTYMVGTRKDSWKKFL